MLISLICTSGWAQGRYEDDSGNVYTGHLQVWGFGSGELSAEEVAETVDGRAGVVILTSPGVAESLFQCGTIDSLASQSASSIHPAVRALREMLGERGEIYAENAGAFSRGVFLLKHFAGRIRAGLARVVVYDGQAFGSVPYKKGKGGVISDISACAVPFVLGPSGQPLVGATFTGQFDSPGELGGVIMEAATAPLRMARGLLGMIFGAAIGTPFPGHTIDDFEAFIEKEQGVTRGAYSAVLVINLTTETSYLVCKGHDGKYHEVARYKGRIPRVAIMPTRHVPSRPEQSGAASEARAEGTNRETLSHPEDSGVLEAISLYRAVDVGALAYRASCDPAGLRLELRNNTESPLCVVIPDGMVWESGDGVAQTVVAGG